MKYKTKAVGIVNSDENYVLRNQSAQDFGRHDFIKDIHRLENYVSANSRANGYAVMLTNDSSYWSESRKNSVFDLEFRLHEGRTLAGEAKWDEKACEVTRRERDTPIRPHGIYHISWRDYSCVGARNAEVFRYLALRVPGIETKKAP